MDTKQLFLRTISTSKSKKSTFFATHVKTLSIAHDPNSDDGHTARIISVCRGVVDLTFWFIPVVEKVGVGSPNPSGGSSGIGSGAGGAGGSASGGGGGGSPIMGHALLSDPNTHLSPFPFSTPLSLPLTLPTLTLRSHYAHSHEDTADTKSQQRFQFASLVIPALCSSLSSFETDALAHDDKAKLHHTAMLIRQQNAALFRSALAELHPEHVSALLPVTDPEVLFDNGNTTTSSSSSSSVGGDSPKLLLVSRSSPCHTPPRFSSSSPPPPPLQYTLSHQHQQPYLPISLNHSLLSHTTHLSIQNRWEDWVAWARCAEFARLPYLTHLALDLQAGFSPAAGASVRQEGKEMKGRDGGGGGGGR